MQKLTDDSFILFDDWDFIQEKFVAEYGTSNKESTAPYQVLLSRFEELSELSSVVVFHTHPLGKLAASWPFWTTSVALSSYTRHQRSLMKRIVSKEHELDEMAFDSIDDSYFAALDYKQFIESGCSSLYLPIKLRSIKRSCCRNEKEEIIGSLEAKRALEEIVMFPIKYPELFKMTGLRPKSG
jgi:hypothetical protein